MHLCPHAHGSLPTLMKTGMNLSWTLELPAMGWGMFVLERHTMGAHSGCAVCLHRSFLGVLMGLSCVGFVQGLATHQSPRVIGL